MASFPQAACWLRFYKLKRGLARTNAEMELRTKEHESLNPLCGGQKLEGKKDYTQIHALHNFRKLSFFKKKKLMRKTQ